MSQDQPSLAIDENVVDSSRAAAVTSLRIDGSISACHSHTTRAASHEGHGNMISTWSRCFPDVNTQGLENKSYGICGSSSLPLHGHGYTPQMPQRQHASFTTPPLSAGCNGQLYNVQELPNPDPSCHQQLISQNVPNFVSQTSLSPTKLSININPQGDDNRIASQPCYLSKTGFAMGKNYLGGSEGLNFFQQGFDGFESSQLLSERSKYGNEKGSLMHFASTTAGSKPIGCLGLSVNDLGTASQQKESFYGFGSHLCPRYKSYPQGQSNRNPSYDSCSMLGMNGQRWPTLHEARQGGRCNGVACSCNFSLDTLSERNRGPRAFRPRSQTVTNGYATDNHRDIVADVYNESYNCLDFVVNYKDAKFFVIKSYSEDNVHKSIKYGVWASTPNGNKKLDAAYHEVKKKHGNCPVFLLFSVNASAQFCGVAEMVGPVDFDKSVDYWQQDKWSGQFPVKWHIIKDVSNAQFRHIVLQNNDNKPVTNSRDTQEVELEQGIEMLKTFKNYESESSILDDFQFYEERQKMMQARKSRQQANQVAAILTGDRGQHPISVSNDHVKKLSKSFAQAVSLNEDESNSSMTHPPVQHENRS